jgi:hypothetical protein
LFCFCLQEGTQIAAGGGGGESGLWGPLANILFHINGTTINQSIDEFPINETSDDALAHGLNLTSRLLYYYLPYGYGSGLGGYGSGLGGYGSGLGYSYGYGYGGQSGYAIPQYYSYGYIPYYG